MLAEVAAKQRRRAGAMAQSIDFRREMLARTMLFGALEDGQLDSLIQLSTTRQLKAREELCHKGDEGTQLFLIQSGRLKVVTTSVEGSDLTFTVMGPGEVVGELALLGAGIRTATISALERCDLLVIERRDFLQLLRENSEVSIQLLQILARRVARLSETMEDSQFLNLPARLAKKLLALGRAYGKEEAEGVRIQLKLSQSELADLVATTRESVNKQIKTWRDEGVLSMESGRIILHRTEALEDAAEANR